MGSPARKEVLSSPDPMNTLTEPLILNLAEDFTISLPGFRDVISVVPVVDSF